MATAGPSGTGTRVGFRSKAGSFGPLVRCATILRGMGKTLHTMPTMQDAVRPAEGRDWATRPGR
jgi:hypothetical protein